jgi:hypothetical protein
VHSFGESGDLTQEPAAAPELEIETGRAELSALSAGEEFDTLPDIEIVLEDEEDRDEHCASVEPPIELSLERPTIVKQVAPPKPAAKPLAPKPQPPKLVAAPAAPAPKPPRAEEDLDLEIDIDVDLDGDMMGDADRDALEFSKPIAVELEFAKPLASDEQGRRLGAGRGELSEADFTRAGPDDEAARIYQSVLSSPQHPRRCCAWARWRRPRQGAAVGGDIAGNAFGDTMVCEPGAADHVGSRCHGAGRAAVVELSVIGEDTIPLIEASSRRRRRIVIAEDSAAPLESSRRTRHHELDETSSDGRGGRVRLAAMLDEDDAHTSQTIGTLIGVGSVGRGFARCSRPSRASRSRSTRATRHATTWRSPTRDGAQRGRVRSSRPC